MDITHSQGRFEEAGSKVEQGWVERMKEYDSRMNRLLSIVPSQEL